MGGLSSLGVSLPTLVAQIVNVAILFGLLYLVAYRPIMRMLDQRSQKIKESMEQAEAIRAQSVSAEEQIKKQLEAAGREGQERIARAAQTGEGLKRKAAEEAREEGEALLDRARAEIQRERDEAIGELRQEFAELTVLAAEKVIERSLDKKAHRQLIDKVLEESTALKKG